RGLAGRGRLRRRRGRGGAARSRLAGILRRRLGRRLILRRLVVARRLLALPTAAVLALARGLLRLVIRALVLLGGRVGGLGGGQEGGDAARLRRDHVVVAVGDQQEGAGVVAEVVEAVERPHPAVDEPQQVAEAVVLVERRQQLREV